MILECEKWFVKKCLNNKKLKNLFKIKDSAARALWIRSLTGINRLRPDLWYPSFLHAPKTQKLNTPQNSKCTQSKRSMNGTDVIGCAHPIESGCAKWFVTKYPKNKKLKNSFKIKVWSASSLNTNPYGDKSTTARFVVPFIPSYAKNSKTEHTPKVKMHTQYKNH